MIVTTIDSAFIKEIASNYGADLCGIASIDRFKNAPIGFHPTDIFEPAKSVISIACKVPESTLFAKNPIPYSVTEDIMLNKVQAIAVSISLELEKYEIKAMISPSVPYDYWDEENMDGRGILSLKHVGYLAGIGFIGRNSLLCNREYGNLIRLSAIITDSTFEADLMYENSLCSNTCNICEKSCPVGAIENGIVNQKKCRPYSEIVNKRGVEVTVCNNCRKFCPNRSGF